MILHFRVKAKYEKLSTYVIKINYSLGQLFFCSIKSMMKSVIEICKYYEHLNIY
jgi:hypothetical protein